MLSVDPFLTDYDPSDLPGASIDPLGFDRGYQFLAESILPGLTNVANRPRYWSALCAAIAISDDESHGAETPRQRYARRLDAVQRLERLWALACVHAAGNPKNELSEEGIRGLRYVQREIRRQEDRDASTTDGDYKLLARQLQYGMVGIYSSVAERLMLVEKELALHTEFGQQLASAFIEETELPARVQKAVVEKREVPLKELAAWGMRAHHTVVPGDRERAVLRRAFDQNDVRRRMGLLLTAHPWAEQQTELARLAVLETATQADESNRDLYEGLHAVRYYEGCFQLCALGFYRLLWLVGKNGSLPVSQAAADPPLQEAREQLRATAGKLDQALTAPRSLTAGQPRWRDALDFVKATAQAATPAEFVDTVLTRHRDVQHAKYDRGIRKTPWLEVSSGTIRLTLSQAQRVDFEPNRVEQMAPHQYRTIAAGRLVAGGAA